MCIRFLMAAAITTTMSVTLAGCQWAEHVVAPVTSSTTTVYGALNLTQDAEQTPLDLPRVISPTLDEREALNLGPDKVAAETFNTNSFGTRRFGVVTDWFFSPAKPNVVFQRRMAEALIEFDHLKDDATKESRRNQVQEQLIAKSASLCANYKKSILQASAEQNLITGDATTLLAGLAAVFTGAAAARPLAASAAVISGFRSEYNADVFANLNLQTITSGIEKRRTEYYAAILKARSCTIQQYPLTEAIKDAFYYHDSCSLYAGLEEANLSIKQAQSPGVDQLADSLNRLAGTVAASKRVVIAASGLPNSAPTPSDLSVTPTSYSVSGTCQLPIPGDPKGSQVPATTSAKIQTVTGSVTMPFTSSNDPTQALAFAVSAINNASQSAISQVDAATFSDVPTWDNSWPNKDHSISITQGEAASKVIEELRKYYVDNTDDNTDHAGPLYSAAQYTPTGSTSISAEKAHTQYETAVAVLQSKADPSGKEKQAVIAAQGVNSAITSAINDQLAAFNAELKTITDDVAKTKPQSTSSSSTAAPPSNNSP